MVEDASPAQQPVPVLVYHAVTERPGRHIADFTVRPAEFRRHLAAVVGAGYRCLTFTDLMRLRASGAGQDATGAPPGVSRIAVLTFDDGYLDFFTDALPALQAHALPSTLYATTGWLEGGSGREPGPSDRMLSWSQLPELIDAGVEVGSHSHSHPHMDTMRSSAVEAELLRSKDLLEDALGRGVPSFAYPHGYHGRRVRRLTEQAGYESAAAVGNAVSGPQEHPFSVSRLMVTRRTTAADLEAWLLSADSAPPRYRESLRTKGWRAYRRGKALVHRRPCSDYR